MTSAGWEGINGPARDLLITFLSAVVPSGWLLSCPERPHPQGWREGQTGAAFPQGRAGFFYLQVRWLPIRAWKKKRAGATLAPAPCPDALMVQP